MCETLVVGRHGRHGWLLSICCVALGVVDVRATSRPVAVGHWYLLRAVHTGSTARPRTRSLSRSSRVAIRDRAVSIPLIWWWPAHRRRSEAGAAVSFFIVAILGHLLPWERIDVGA